MISLKQLHELSVDLAIKRGPRSKKEIDERLKELNDGYKKMDAKAKKFFDMESLTNPFLDSRIEFGDPNTKIKRALVGIDITVGEVLLANELSKSGKKIDAIISHHPEGYAFVCLTKVMDLQEDLAELDGVAPNVAQKLMRSRISDVNRGLHAANHYAAVDAAKLLGIPLVSLHTVADNQCYYVLSELMKKSKPRLVGDIVEACMGVKEYQMAAMRGLKPMIVCGDEKMKVGKISISGITGGTSGSKDMYEKMAQAGVGTIICMHIPEEHRKLAEQFNLNVVVLPHMASDSLGVNTLLNEVMKKGSFEILTCGGYLR